MYYDPYNTNSQKQGYLSGALLGSQQKAGSMGNMGGEESSPINWDDLASTSNSSSYSQSYTGPPDWMKDWGKDWWGKYMNSLGSVYGNWKTSAEDNTMQSNLNNYQQGKLDTGLQGMEGYIDKARQLMPQQYLNQMSLYNERATQPVLNRMSNRGILNSSVTGSALSDVLRDTQAKYSDKVSEAELWAANQGYDLSKYGTEKNTALAKDYADKTYNQRQSYLENMFKQLGISEQMMPNLMAALRESQSESQSEGQSNSGLMGLLEMLMG